MSVIIVLSDCPPKLRGDMSKWLFEINTGVYVGNISARVREHLWQRITENIGHGHATMVFSANGEQHMDFRVHNAYREPVDFDGIKLMRRPERRIENVTPDSVEEIVFSNAAKHQILAAHKKKQDKRAAYCASSYVVLDLETTGLDTSCDQIIEIGAILVDRGKVIERMQVFVATEKKLSSEIIKLTGITDDDLTEKGISLKHAVHELLEFAEDLPIVCYNAVFDRSFLESACMKVGEKIENRYIDVLALARVSLPNLGSYKLSTVAAQVGVPIAGSHRAMADCETTFTVYTKLMQMISSDPQNNA